MSAAPPPDRQRLYYTLGVAGLIVAIALARWDLVTGAFRMTVSGLQTRPLVALGLLGEVILFGGILALTLRVIPTKVSPRRDATMFLLASIGGFLIESWGTQTGLWTYYTGETPPLWIIPAWPLGTLIIDRMSEKAKARWAERVGDAAVWGYWAFAVTCPLIVSWFAWTRMSHPGTPLMILTFILAFYLKPDPKEDFWILIGGKFYVFFAVFWGATNNCWRYHIQTGSFSSLAAGIVVELFCDSALVLTFIRLTRLAERLYRRR